VAGGDEVAGPAPVVVTADTRNTGPEPYDPLTVIDGICVVLYGAVLAGADHAMR
jgi:hypothetical protein